MKLSVHTRILLPLLMVLSFVWGFPGVSHSLVIDGKEVEDIYAYIIKTLEEEAKSQEQYKLEVQKNPNYGGYRPYTYSSLRHLSTEDIVYGALQGGLTARRELGPQAPWKQIAARAESNINRVMELFPMLAKDFNCSDVLLSRMAGSGYQDQFQIFLLKRSWPGFANDSLFSVFWREELQRNRHQFIKTLEDICDAAFSDQTAVDYALRVYAKVVEADYQEAFEKDREVGKLIETRYPDLTPEKVLQDPALQAELSNFDDLEQRTRELVLVRDRFAVQLEPNLSRQESIRKLATQLLQEFNEKHPSIEKYAEEVASGKPMVMEPVAAPEVKPDSTEPKDEDSSPPAAPKIGIPSLKGF